MKPAKENGSSAPTPEPSMPMRTLARNVLTMSHIVHQPAHDLPPPSGDAYIHVRDNLNAPSFEIGDVLQVDLSVTTCRWDGIYVLQQGGRQVVRLVQRRGGTGGEDAFYVFTASAPALGFLVAKHELVVLGAVRNVCAIRRVG